MCDRLKQRNTNGNDNGIGNGNHSIVNHGKGLIMKKTLGLLLALVITLGICMATARAQTRTWTGAGDMIWTQPDDNSFDATYNSGNAVVFGSTGAGAIAIAAGGVTPGGIAVNASGYTFKVADDNGLGTATITRTNYSTMTIENAKVGTLSLANAFNTGAAGTNYDFTGGDFLLTGTIYGGGNGGPAYRPNTGVTVTVQNGFTNGEFIVRGPGTLRILAASTSRLSQLSNGGVIEFHHDNSLGTGGTLAFPAWTSGTLVAGGGDRNMARNISPAYSTLIVDGPYNLTLSGVISHSYGAIRKDGEGTLILTNNNTYGGITTVNAGVLRLMHADALGGGNLRLSGGVVELGAGDMTHALGTGAGQVRWVTGSGGFSAHGADRVVNLGGSSAQFTWGAGNFVPSGQTLIFGSSNANGQLDFQNPISLGASGTNTRTIQVNDNPLSTADVALLSNTISGSVGNSLNKTGDGVLILAGNNTYQGTTTVSAGTLRADHANALGTGNIVLAGGTLQYTAASAGQDWGGRMKNSTAAIQLDTNGQSVSLSGIDSSNTGGLTKLGAGALTLTGTHTYTGPTTLEAGSLLINGTTTAGSAITVNGGTLGGSGVALGSITVNAGGTLSPGASIESLGSGALTLNDGSTFAYELDTANLNGDLLSVDGGVTFAGTVTLTLAELAAGKVAIGDKLTLIAATDPWSGSLFTYEGSLLADGAFFDLGVNKWQFAYNDTTGGMNFAVDQAGMSYFITMTAIPEPTSGLLLALAGLAIMKRRRR